MSLKHEPTTKKNLLIFGAGAVGRNVRMILKEAWPDAEDRFLGFLDDKTPGKEDLEKLDGAFLGGMEYFESNPPPAVFVGIACPQARKTVVDRLKSLGINDFPILLHPQAWIGDRAKIAEGTIIYPFAALDIDTSIGPFTIVNTQSSIGHDTRTGSFVTLCPGVDIGGNVQVADQVFFGIGSSTIQGISIGERVHVGAGATVIQNVKANSKVRAVPASIFPKNESQ